MTRNADEARIRQEMAAAIAGYAGPVTKCPPGKARGGTGKVKLLIRPRYRAKPPRRYTAAAMTRGAEINRQRTPKLTIIAAPCGPTTRSILFGIKSRYFLESSRHLLC